MICLKRLFSVCWLMAFFVLMTLEVYGQKQIEPIYINEGVKSVSLKNHFVFATSKKNNQTLKELNQLNWIKADSSTVLFKHMVGNIFQFWLQFKVKADDHADSVLLLSLPLRMHKACLYKVEGNKLDFVGETGYGSKQTNLSVPADYNRIFLPLERNKEMHFYLSIQKYIYKLTPQIPEIETFDEAYSDKLHEIKTQPSVYTNTKLWFAGFYFAVFLYCCLKYFFQRRDKAYLYYSAAAVSWFFRYSLQVDAIVIEFNWLPLNNGFFFLLSFIPQNIFYILFLKSFLKTGNNKYLNGFVNICLVSWILMIPVFILHYFHPEVTVITEVLWGYQALPLIVLGVWLAIYVKKRLTAGYFKFAFWGLVIISGALIFSMVPRWLNFFSLMPAWYHWINNRIDIITFAFGADAILFLGSLAYRDRIDERERAALRIKNFENTHKILNLQMNPHFVFNCLNSINLYIEQNDGELASNYLNKFSQLMRISLVNSRKDRVLLSEEIKVLGLYLELEGMRFKGKLNYTFEVAEDVDTDFIEIPTMFIQPYIENAIWHGLMHKEEGGHIEIKIKQDDKLPILRVTIQDDGIGRVKSNEIKSNNKDQKKSYATIINNERIENFNKRYNTATSVVIEDLYNEKKQAVGTLVSINIYI